jgi:hypothetical protein
MFELFLEKSRALIRFAALSSLTTVFKPLFFCPLIGELELFTENLWVVLVFNSIL